MIVERKNSIEFTIETIKYFLIFNEIFEMSVNHH